MNRLRVWTSRALDLALARWRERRLDEEIRNHLDLLTEEYAARGMSPAEARQAARRAFGGVDQLKGRCREARGLPVLQELLQDARFTVRLMRRSPGFFSTAVIILGLGLGVNSMFFAILYAHTMRGLPIDRADRVVVISASHESRMRGLTHAELERLQERASSLAGVAAFVESPMVLAQDDAAPERFDGARISAATFEVIGVRPMLGRDFVSGDEGAGAAPVALIAADAGRARYGGGPILGRAVSVNGQAATIVGVMPERSGFPGTARVWLPLRRPAGEGLATDGEHLQVFARLQDGIAVSDAQVEISQVLADSRSGPAAPDAARASATPINSRFLGSLTHPAWLAFLTAGCLIVLISCANVANLLLGRLNDRARELAVRASLGASRGRLIRQQLMEGLCMAALGGLLGLGVAQAGLRIFSSAIPPGILPYWLDYSFDGRILVVLAGVSCATVLLFALLPAAHASGTDILTVLRTGTDGRSTNRGRRWSTTVLALELGLAVVLLAHLVASFRTAGPVPEAEHVVSTPAIVTAGLVLPEETYPTAARREAFYDALRDQMQRLPGVRAAMASHLPLLGGADRRLELAGIPGEPRPIRVVEIGDGYFETLGLRLARGETFTGRRLEGGLPAAIVNQRFVETYLPDENPLGRRLGLHLPEAAADERSWHTIVGVAPDIRQQPGAEPEPIAYVPLASAGPPAVAFIVRSSMEPGAVVSILRAEAQAIDPHLPLHAVRTMAQVARDAQWNGRLSSRLFLSLTLVAVALATAGMFAVTAHAVSLRTRDIGLRLALGARPRHVLRMILRTASAQLALGFGVGIVLTAVWTAIFPGGTATILATDPRALLGLLAMLAAMGAIAWFVPVRRALRLDPLRALRHE